MCRNRRKITREPARCYSLGASPVKAKRAQRRCQVYGLSFKFALKALQGGISSENPLRPDESARDKAGDDTGRVQARGEHYVVIKTHPGQVASPPAVAQSGLEVAACTPEKRACHSRRIGLPRDSVPGNPLGDGARTHCVLQRELALGAAAEEHDVPPAAHETGSHGARIGQRRHQDEVPSAHHRKRTRGIRGRQHDTFPAHPLSRVLQRGVPEIEAQELLAPALPAEKHACGRTRLASRMSRITSRTSRITSRTSRITSRTSRIASRLARVLFPGNGYDLDCAVAEGMDHGGRSSQDVYHDDRHACHHTGIRFFRKPRSIYKHPRCLLH